MYASAHLAQVEPGQFFFHQDEPGETMYVLIEGQIKMTLLGPEGRQVLIRIVAPCEDFGAVSAIVGTPYPLTAEAVTRCQALAWDQPAITSSVEAYPTLRENALQVAVRRFHQLQARFRELATESAEQRIARTLLRLADQAGRSNGEGMLIDLTLSRSDLAEMTGTSLYTVSRILSQWERHGLLKNGREKVLIRDLSKLTTVAKTPDTSSLI
ncbi:MAG: Crp/Fnr family transcriptional regulator [Anaerolineae bacterium]|nr:Crp/Fnr family transcriptional regulator [Anaerolineae bacterium]